jgi:hypothetical protein
VNVYGTQRSHPTGESIASATRQRRVAQLVARKPRRAGLQMLNQRQRGFSDQRRSHYLRRLRTRCFLRAARRRNLQSLLQLLQFSIHKNNFRFGFARKLHLHLVRPNAIVLKNSFSNS